jgi:hypothetical protein
LSESVRAFFEPRLGYDFSQVRVHTHSHAKELARTLNARAFTLGRDIVFEAGQYAPATSSGRWLLAHELTHTLQQGFGTSTLTVETPHLTHENNGEVINSVEALQVSSVARTIQRQCQPLATCPVMSIDIGGGLPRWEAAEKCLQDEYGRQHRANVVGYNKEWLSFTGRPRPEQDDIDCFRPHFVAKSGMEPAEPDIFDFTIASIHEITSWRQQLKPRKRGKYEAEVHEAYQLAKATHNYPCSGRDWSRGWWTPSPCFWLGGNLYMRVANVSGILTYQMLNDVSKETITIELAKKILEAHMNWPPALAEPQPAKRAGEKQKPVLDPWLPLFLGGAGLLLLFALASSKSAAALATGAALVLLLSNKAEASDHKEAEPIKGEKEEIELHNLRQLSNRFDWSALNDGQVRLTFKDETEELSTPLRRDKRFNATLYAHVGGTGFVSFVRVRVLIENTDPELEIAASSVRVATKPRFIRDGSVLIGTRFRLPEEARKILRVVEEFKQYLRKP